MNNLKGFLDNTCHNNGTLSNKKLDPKEKIFYDCECGKRYDAFPGLYLHFKRKHNTKISSHPTEQRYKIRSTPLCKVITYFHTENPYIPQTDPLLIVEMFYSKFKLITQEFFKGEKSDKNQKQISLIAVDKFCLFLTNEIQKKKESGEEEFLNNIPYAFNQFFLKQIENGSVTQKNCEEWRHTLASLSTWLHRKGYSEFTAIENEGFSLEK